MKKTTFWKLLKDDKKQILIPINQREYAQGRQNSKSNEVRATFAAAIRDALAGDDPISLDLVYGGVEDGKLVPYDGQQRLTTLFLLHWLVAKRAGKLDEETRDLLRDFRYDLREETQKFCEKLIGEADGLNFKRGDNLRTVVRDQAWYDAKWDRDPSVSGMLTMLDALDDKLEDIDWERAWKKLTEEDAITFLYEEIDKLGGVAGEELYITMNSRGKELDDFEKFKPNFLELIAKKYSKAKAAEFAKKIDGEWLDFFWRNFGRIARTSQKSELSKDEITDAAFYKFLEFIFDALRFLPLADEKIAPLPEIEPVAALFRLAELALNPEREQFWPDHPNIDFLEFVLDKLSAYEGTLDDLFNEYFHAAGESGAPTAGKISLFDAQANLLDYICDPDKEATHPRRYMTLGFLLWLAAERDGIESLRHLRNLTNNSPNELGRDEDMGRQLIGMATLVLNGLDAIGRDEVLKERYLQSRYNGRQLKEELVKQELAATNADVKKRIYWLEDNPFLRGNLSVAYSGDGIEPAFEPSELDKIYNLFLLGLGDPPIEWNIWLKALLATGAFDWWTEKGFFWWKSSLRLYNDSQIKRREIFIGQEPAERLPYSQNSVREIATWGKNSDSKKKLIDIINKKCDKWLNDRKEEKALSWVWYFAKYRETLPGDSAGYYHWGYSPWSFLQRQLSKTYVSSENWNPFLKAVWEEAGLEKEMEERNNLNWHQESGADSVNYIAFPCGLTLRAAEFGWLILTQAGHKPHSQAFGELQKKYPQLNDNGYFYIPGVNRLDGEERQNMSAEWKADLNSATDDDGANWRISDNSDRIAVGAELARTLLEL